MASIGEFRAELSNLGGVGCVKLENKWTITT